MAPSGLLAHAPMTPEVGLRPWAEDDLSLMERLLGDPRMTEHLGGPGSAEQIRRRLDGYLAGDGTDGRMFVVVAGEEREPAGSIGYWGHEWQGETVWETGWSVLPEFQGQGIATRAAALIGRLAAAERRHRSLHAFPSIDNGPSDAVCRNAGFTLLGSHSFEYPKGHVMQCNDWAITLDPAVATPGP